MAKKRKRTRNTGDDVDSKSVKKARCEISTSDYPRAQKRPMSLFKKNDDSGQSHSEWEDDQKKDPDWDEDTQSLSSAPTSSSEEGDEDWVYDDRNWQDHKKKRKREPAVSRTSFKENDQEWLGDQTTSSKSRGTEERGTGSVKESTYYKLEKCRDKSVCEICRRTFVNLQAHLKGHETDEQNQTISGIYQCQNCFKWYKDVKKFSVHRFLFCPAVIGNDITLENPKSYSCEICGEFFPSQPQLTVHQQNEKCIEKYDRKQHEGTEEGLASGEDDDEPSNAGMCKLCERTFGEILDPIDHRRHHQKDHENQTASGAHACPHCTKKYNNAIDLTFHIDFCCSIHRMGSGKFVCGICDAQCSDSDVFNLHLEAHAREIEETPSNVSNAQVKNKLYRCGICGLEFKKLANLNSHYSIKHKRKKTKGMIYDQVSGLDNCQGQTLKRPSKDILPMNKSEGDDQSPIATFSCGKCGAEFVSHTDLNMHHVTHKINNKQQKKKKKKGPKVTCPKCGKTFGRFELLKIHNTAVHVNKGKDVYVCKECGKGYGAPSLLKVHMKYQTKTRLKCRHCEMVFFSHRSRKRHETMRHTSRSMCEYCGKFIAYSWIGRHRTLCQKNQMKGKVANKQRQINPVCPSRPSKVLSSVPAKKRQLENVPNEGQFSKNKNVPCVDVVPPVTPEILPKEVSLDIQMKPQEWYKCHKCLITFELRTNYEIHRKICKAEGDIANAEEMEIPENVEFDVEAQNTNKARILTCQKCLDIFCTPLQLVSHEATHKYETCSACNILIPDEEALQMHLRVECPAKFGANTKEPSPEKNANDFEISAEADEVVEGNAENRCSDCEVRFMSAEGLKEHKRVVSMSEGKFPSTCQLCINKFSNKFKHKHKNHKHEHTFVAQTECHLLQHRKEFNLTCKFCGQHFSNVNDLMKHITAKKHPYLNSKSCPACQRIFDPEEYIKHMEYNKKESENLHCKCLSCGKMCNSPKALDQHAAYNKYYCSICSQHFYRSSYKTHREKEHNANAGEIWEKNPNICKHCNTSFARASELSAHVKTVLESSSQFLCSWEEDHFTCLRCGLSFVKHSDFKAHLSFWEHNCYLCHMHFSRSFTALKHSMTHTDALTGTIQEQSSLNLQKCKYCGLQYINIITKRKHEKQLKSASTTYFPKSCEVCSETLHAPCQLKVHQKSHELQIGVSCRFCRKQFKSAMQPRLLHHSKDLDEMCDVCGARLWNSCQKRTHLNKHSLEIKECVKPPNGQDCTLECPFCQRQFGSVESRASHLLQVKMNFKEICKVCNTELAFSCEKVKHIKKHTSGKICSYCGQHLIYPPQKKHKKILDKSYRCPCGEMIQTVCHKQVHEAMYQFVCCQCHQHFKRFEEIVNHLLGYFKSDAETVVEKYSQRKKKDVSEKKSSMWYTEEQHGKTVYLCLYCGNTMETLEQKLSHTAEFMYECHHCRCHFNSTLEMFYHFKTQNHPVKSKKKNQLDNFLCLKKSTCLKKAEFSRNEREQTLTESRVELEIGKEVYFVVPTNREKRKRVTKQMFPDDRFSSREQEVEKSLGITDPQEFSSRDDKKLKQGDWSKSNEKEELQDCGSFVVTEKDQRTCKFCKKTCTSEVGLKAHLQKEDTGGLLYTCSKCKRSFNKMCAITHHIARVCMTCGKHFDDRSVRIKHQAQCTLLKRKKELQMLNANESANQAKILGEEDNRESQSVYSNRDAEKSEVMDIVEEPGAGDISESETKTEDADADKFQTGSDTDENVSDPMKDTEITDALSTCSENEHKAVYADYTGPKLDRVQFDTSEKQKQKTRNARKKKVKVVNSGCNSQNKSKKKCVWTCEFCYQTFKSLPSLIRHKQSNALKGMECVCTYCDIELLTECHAKYHNKKFTYVCRKCKKHFNRADLFKRHEKHCYPCELCQHNSPNPERLETHKRRWHQIVWKEVSVVDIRSSTQQTNADEHSTEAHQGPSKQDAAQKNEDRPIAEEYQDSPSKQEYATTQTNEDKPIAEECQDSPSKQEGAAPQNEGNSITEECQDNIKHHVVKSPATASQGLTDQSGLDAVVSLNAMVLQKLSRYAGSEVSTSLATCSVSLGQENYSAKFLQEPSKGISYSNTKEQESANIMKCASKTPEGVIEQSGLDAFERLNAKILQEMSKYPQSKASTTHETCSLSSEQEDNSARVLQKSSGKRNPFSLCENTASQGQTTLLHPARNPSLPSKERVNTSTLHGTDVSHFPPFSKCIASSPSVCKNITPQGLISTSIHTVSDSQTSNTTTTSASNQSVALPPLLSEIEKTFDKSSKTSLLSSQSSISSSALQLSTSKQVTKVPLMSSLASTTLSSQGVQASDTAVSVSTCTKSPSPNVTSQTFIVTTQGLRPCVPLKVRNLVTSPPSSAVISTNTVKSMMPSSLSYTGIMHSCVNKRLRSMSSSISTIASSMAQSEVPSSTGLVSVVPSMIQGVTQLSTGQRFVTQSEVPKSTGLVSAVPSTIQGVTRGSTGQPFLTQSEVPLSTGLVSVVPSMIQGITQLSTGQRFVTQSKVPKSTGLVSAVPSTIQGVTRGSTGQPFLTQSEVPLSTGLVSVVPSMIQGVTQLSKGQRFVTQSKVPTSTGLVSAVPSTIQGVTRGSTGQPFLTQSEVPLSTGLVSALPSMAQGVTQVSTGLQGLRQTVGILPVLQGICPASVATGLLPVVQKRDQILTQHPAVAQETVTKPVTQKAVTKSVTQETVTKPVTQKAVTKSVTQETVTKPVTQKAVTKSVTQETVTKPVTQKAVTKSVTQETLTKPVTQETVKKPVTQKAVTKSVTQETVAKPVTQKAVTKSVTQETVAKPVTQKAVTKSVTQETVTKPVTQKAVTKSVTQETVTKPVTQKAVTKSVTQKAVTKSVTQKAVTNSVTQETVTKPVTQKAVTKSVTQETVTKPVTQKEVTKSVTQETLTKPVTLEKVQMSVAQEVKQVSTGLILEENRGKLSSGQTPSSALPVALHTSTPLLSSTEGTSKKVIATQFVPQGVVKRTLTGRECEKNSVGQSSTLLENTAAEEVDIEKADRQVVLSFVREVESVKLFINLEGETVLSFPLPDGHAATITPSLKLTDGRRVFSVVIIPCDTGVSTKKEYLLNIGKSFVYKVKKKPNILGHVTYSVVVVPNK